MAALGVNLPALAFQILNFAVVLWLLQKLAYKPMLRVFAERRQRIEEGLKNATDLAQQRQELEERRRMVLADAQKNAREIITAAEQAAGNAAAQMAAQAQAARDTLFADAKTRIEHDVAQAKRALQRELLGLVAAAASQVVGEKIDAKQDAALIQHALVQAQGMKQPT